MKLCLCPPPILGAAYSLKEQGFPESCLLGAGVGCWGGSSICLDEGLVSFSSSCSGLFGALIVVVDDPMATALRASLSSTNSQNLLKLMSIELMKASDHLILCHPFLTLPSIFPSIRVFSKESSLCIRLYLP